MKNKRYAKCLQVLGSYLITLFTVTGLFSSVLWAEWLIETVDSTGMVGSHNSIALDNNNYPHISYLGNADLKYAKWTGLEWSIETVDSVGSAGYNSSIALDSNYYPHISYWESSGGDLKYARWTGSGWSTETVDSADDVGMYSSLALDSNNYPHISYYDRTNSDLKYARWTGSAWLIETVDSAGIVGSCTSIVLDSNNYPHISYCHGGNGDLKYAKWTGSSWLIETVDSADYVGGYTSIALDGNDYPHISHFNNTNTDLKYARWNGSDWLNETVDGGARGVGRYTSLALDGSDYPHISYHDETNNDLKYARWTGNDWSIETVDSVGNADLYTSLVLDSNDYPHISYHDNTNNDLKYARWDMPSGPSYANYTKLHEFAGGIDDGRYPHGSLTLSNSTLYGMTREGGTNDYGVIFKLNTDGTAYTNLHEFAGGAGDGENPHGSLTLSESDSTLYGMTREGGTSGRGVIFKINTDGTGYSKLHEFTGGIGGEWSYSSLTLSDSTLYGMTCNGGTNDSGVIFKLSTGGTGYTILHSFAGGAGDGAYPNGFLTLNNSTLYGMTPYGGTNNDGVIFKLSTDGTGYAILHSFAGGAGDGGWPGGSLTLSDSTLYGMAQRGGINDKGAIFKLNTDGTGYTNLHEFTGGAGDGCKPRASLTLSDSTLYGMT